MDFGCKIKILTLVFVFCSRTLYSHTSYFTYLNEFDALKKSEMLIENRMLCDKNLSYEESINTVKVNVEKATFDTYIRFKNLNNKERNKYKVYGKNGETKKISNPYWGYVWNFRNEQNYYAVSMKGCNTVSHDILDRRLLQVDIYRMCNGKKDVLKTLQLNEFVDVYDGFNVIQIKYDGDNTSIYIGNKEPKCIGKLQNVEYSDSMGVGYIIGPGSELQLERVVYKNSIIKEYELSTEWNKDEIDSYIKNKSNYIIGIWKYLDRNIDGESIKLGGKYTLAIVKSNNNDYDILYYDGSVVNSSKWKCGMIKGRLKRTKFQDNFDLIWYDSMLNVISDDTYAVVETENILTLYFPVEKCQIRFVKQ